MFVINSRDPGIPACSSKISNAMPPILELNAVSKTYGRAHELHTVLRDVNLTVAEGDFVSIIGYSGSGKSSLINLVAGLLKPSTGSAMMDGKPIDGPGPERGIVFQNYSLLPWLTVTENVRLAVDQLFPNLSESKRVEHTAKYVDMVKLTPASGKYPRELSGGMRQRDIACALWLNFLPLPRGWLCQKITKYICTKDTKFYLNSINSFSSRNNLLTVTSPRTEFVKIILSASNNSAKYNLLSLMPESCFNNCFL